MLNLNKSFDGEGARQRRFKYKNILIGELSFRGGVSIKFKKN